MDSMGQKFRVARERKKMTLSRAAALTRIKIQHLEMMENDDFSRMPAPTYAKGFIRIYAGLLGLDPAPLVQEYVDRHLNAPAEERSAPSASSERYDSDQAVESTGGREEQISTVEKIKKELLPQLPRLIVALVIVFLLVSMFRCTSRMVSSAREDRARDQQLLDQRAIMKETPVRYLELPRTEDAQP
ncbi:MAG TPA: helix-turn-helix domain-containing protein [Kiritimatiellia bacterium]|nr:helix-turn-helix domain-containing protein [Kiritimatiellia bacterium]